MPNTGVQFGRQRFSAGLLRLYLYYRLSLALLLLASYVSGIADHIFGVAFPNLFLSIAIIYVVATAVGLGFYQLQNHQLPQGQLFFTLLIDIAAQTLLMYCSGGLISGIGYLLLVTVAAGSIFFTGQLAVLLPAVASICIIAESILGAMLLNRGYDAIFPSGILGLLLFLTSLLFSRLSQALIVAQDVAETESELSAELEEINRLIINRMRTGILVVDDRGEIRQINSAATELLGLSADRIGMKRGDSIRRESRLLKRLLEWRKSPWKKPSPFTPRFGDTQLLPNFADLNQVGKERTIIFLEDLRAATQQAQQLKLASLGRLTGSIAHEIRNPLGAISHAAELLEEIRDQDKTTSRLTEIIKTQGLRMNQIVESVLQLSRQQRPNLRKFDLHPWLASFLSDYKLAHREEPELELWLAEESIDPISFDLVHLTQVLTNLIDNALRYSLESQGEAWAALRTGLGSADKVVNLDVFDKGPGVPNKDRNMLFEPFFTTSTTGSGLGLYMARELCAINFATLRYQAPSSGQPGYFRISFAHPNKILDPAETLDD